MAKYICTVCGYIYDEEQGIADLNIAAGTTFEQLPEDFKCPICKADKSAFALQQEKNDEVDFKVNESDFDYATLSDEEIRAILSNLGRASEKQYKAEHAELFNQLVDYYDKKIQASATESLEQYVEADLDAYETYHAIVDSKKDRGAKRALVWSEKVTRMLDSHLKNAESLLKTEEKIYVCDICGFIHIGDDKPQVCPVCKVPSMKILDIKEVGA